MEYLIKVGAMNKFKDFIEAVPHKVTIWENGLPTDKIQWEDSITSIDQVNVLSNTMFDCIDRFVEYLYTLDKDDRITIFEVTTSQLFNAWYDASEARWETNSNIRQGLYLVLSSVLTLVARLPKEHSSIYYSEKYVKKLRNRCKGPLSKSMFELIEEYSIISIQKKQPQQTLIHPPKVLDVDEAKELRNYLIERGYISNQTKEDDFLYQFGCLDRINETQPIIWTKKNSRTKAASKKSLLDLLVLIGYDEKQIRKNINSVFSIDTGKKFAAQDYSSYKDWKKDVISEYHTELEEIVNKIRKKTT